MITLACHPRYQVVVLLTHQALYTPSYMQTVISSRLPSNTPTTFTSNIPIGSPSTATSIVPSTGPTAIPSTVPSGHPSVSTHPNIEATKIPSMLPSIFTLESNNPPTTKFTLLEARLSAIPSMLPSINATSIPSTYHLLCQQLDQLMYLLAI